MLSIYYDNDDFSLEQMNIPPQLPYELRVTQKYPNQTNLGSSLVELLMLF
jgi:hypothetical protein